MDDDDALMQAIETGQLDETANVDLTRSYATFRKIEILFDLLRLPPEQALPMLAEVAQEVQNADQKGYFHRDFKPDNALLDS